MLAVIVTGLEESLKRYLKEYAECNEPFADKYKNSGKTDKGCYNYIVGKVKELITASGAKGSGGCQIEDDVVYAIAVEYFMNDDIKETKPAPAAPKAEKKANKATKETEQADGTPQVIKSLKLPKSKAEEKKAKAQGQLLQLDLFS